MLHIADLKTDLSDDLIINGDMLVDEDDEQSTLGVIGRRTVGRWDDIVLDDVTAGIERFLYSTKSPLTSENIKSAINRALLADSLLSPTDFKIIIPETNSRTFSILIKFTNPSLNGKPFKVIVDQENQRIYRG